MAENTLSKNIQDTIEYLGNIKTSLEEKGQEMTNVPVEEYSNKIGNLTNTSDATANANDILSPKTAYVNGGKVTGAIIPTYESTEFNTVLTTQISASSYYILDYLPTQKIIVLQEKLEDTKIIIAKINDDNSYDLENALTINISDVGGSWAYITGAKFSYFPLFDNVYNLAIVGNVAEDWGTSSFSVVRIDIDTLTIYESSAYSKYVRATTFANYTYGPYSYYQISASPTDATRFFAISNGNRSDYGDKAKTVMLVANPKSLSLSQGGTALRANNNYCFFDENGKYAICNNSGSNQIKYLIRISDGSTKSNLTGYGCMVNDYIFRDYKLYDWAGNLIKEFNSSYFGITYKYCFYFNNILMLFTDNKLYTYRYDDEEIEFYNIGNYQSVFSPFNPGKLIGYFSLPIYRDNDIYYGIADTTNRVEKIHKDLTNPVLTEMQRININYYNTLKSTTSADKVLNGEKVYNKDGLLKGTMPNNGALNYTPSTSRQTIPAGYTSGGTISAINNQTKSVTPTTEAQIITPDNGYNGLEQVNVSAVTNSIDSNIQEQNIKAGVTILGVEGILEPR